MAPDEIQELRVLANQRTKLVAERSRLTNRINSDMLRFGHVVGQLGRINGSVVRALIEDFCETVRWRFTAITSPTLESQRVWSACSISGGNGLTHSIRKSE